MKLHHVALIVTDLEKSISFYSSYFDFSVEKRFEKPEKGAKAVYLVNKDNQRIELFQFENMQDANVTDIGVKGIRHIAFSVEDIERAVEEYTKRGLSFTKITMGASGKRYCFTQDPDGIQIEFYEE